MKIKSDIAIGVDIGGSHLTCAAVDIQSHAVLSNTLVTYHIDPDAKANSILDTWAEVIGDCIRKTREQKIIGIGIAVPGPFDYSRGISKILGVPKFESLFGVNIRQALLNRLQKYNIPFVWLYNDADCFLMGEYICGSAQDSCKTMGITLGTGLGSAFLENGIPVHRGMGVPLNANLYNQPYHGEIAENYFSTRWFVQEYHSRTGKKITGVKDLVKKSNELIAHEIFDQFGNNLAEFIKPWITQFNADCMILGGNISRAWKWFEEPFSRTLETGNSDLTVYPSQLFDQASIIGASRLAEQKIRRELYPNHLHNIKNHFFVNQKNSLSLSKIRKTRQKIMPVQVDKSESEQYDLYPAFPIGDGKICESYETLAKWIYQHKTVIIDGYAGIFWNKIRFELNKYLDEPDIHIMWYDVRSALKNPDEINEMVRPFLGGDDPIFGTRFTGQLSDFYDEEKLTSIQPDPQSDLCIIIGPGASLVDWDAPLIYVDLPKNEIQYRMRAKAITNLGVEEPENPKDMYKRFYFVDWIALNNHKKQILPKIDLIIDGQHPQTPVWMTGENFHDALNLVTRNVFRVRPWFEPGTWGGQWIKKHMPQLSQNVPNYAWSFEMIVPENGIVFQSDKKLLEVSFDFLMYHDNKAILGEAAQRFGDEFPIRFDFLDTFEGGNLSVQCHPSPDFIREEFGESFTQDETYYILDTKENAEVYLGFQDDIDPEKFRTLLKKSQQKNTPVEIDQFVQKHKASPHDLFLIPNGTIHCSGQNNMVLEISSTPYIYTFKMYDWLRVDLDGNPRPINIERAFENLNFERKGSKVEKELLSTPKIIDSGNDWTVEHLPTHPIHFYDIHRYTFENSVSIETENQANVLMLVEGTTVTVEMPSGFSQTYHFAETFAVPAAARSYRLINKGVQPAKVVKAFVKPEACQ